MVARLTLIEKDMAEGSDVIDEIYGVLINSDDGGSDLVIAAEAIAGLIVAGHDIPDTYFTGATFTHTITAGGLLAADEDLLYFRGNGVGQNIA
jgi:hypothetical protein